MPDAVHPGSRPSNSSTANTRDGGDLAAILRVYADPTLRRLVEHASDVLIQRCMAEAGFDYQVAPPREAPQDAAAMLIDQALGVTTVADAQRYGYVPPLVALDADDDGRADLNSSSEPAFLDALFGTDRGSPESNAVVDDDTGRQVGSLEIRDGCTGSADDQLFGSSEDRASFYSLDLTLQNLAVEAVVKTQSSSPIQSATADWSRCMANAGYDFSTPQDPLEVEWAEPRPSEDEVRTALADVQCKEQAGLISTYRTLLNDAASAVEGQYASTLAEWSEQSDLVTRQALEVTSSG